MLVGCVDGFSAALHAEALRCGGTDAVPVGEGSAFFVLTADEAGSGAHPIVEAVRTGGPGPSAERPVAILSDNDIEHALLALACMHVGRAVCAVSSSYCRLAQGDFARIHGILAALGALLGGLRPAPRRA